MYEDGDEGPLFGPIEDQAPERKKWKVDDLESWLAWKDWQDREHVNRLKERRAERFLVKWGWLVFLLLVAGWRLLMWLGYLG